MPTYTKEQAEELYKTAVENDLSGRSLISNPELVVRDCNGIGAAWMPEKARELITDLNQFAETPAAIHDRRYTIGGNEKKREKADAEFYENCCKMIKAEKGVYNPLRYWYLNKARVFYKLLQKAGSKAWNYGN